MNNKNISRKIIMISCAILVVLLLVVSAYSVSPEALAGASFSEYIQKFMACKVC